jgi:hypothetical protein
MSARSITSSSPAAGSLRLPNAACSRAIGPTTGEGVAVHYAPTNPPDGKLNIESSQAQPVVPPMTDGAPLRADLICVAILGAAWLAMIVLTNPIGDFPLNDDWVYALAVKSILEQGEFRMPSPASTDLFPQAYWGALFCLPFGFSFTALRISTLVLGFVGIVVTYGIVRQLGAGLLFALLAAALVLANPLYFALANAFMTDVPFYAVSGASLFFLVRWSMAPNRTTALVGLLLAMVALLIRQAGIVLPVGFAVAYVAARGLRLRNVALALVPVLFGVALHFGFQTWMQQSGRTPFLSEPPIFETVSRNLRSAVLVPIRLDIFIAYAGLFAFPALFVVAWRVWARSDTSQRRTSLAVFIVACAATVAGWRALGRPMPFIDNVLNEFGIGPLTLTDQYFFGANRPVVPSWLRALWNEATAAAIVGTGLVASLAVHAIRDGIGRPPPSGRTTAMIIVGSACVAYMMLGALALRFFLDRYVLFVLFSTLLCAAFVAGGLPSAKPPRMVIVLLAAVLALEAVFAIVAMRDYLAWNRMRWVATGELLDSGVPRSSIDGGYEFNGWLGFDPDYQRKPGKSPWWVVDDEYMISSGPLRGYSVLRTYPVTTLLPGLPSRVVVLRRMPQ